jgi:hypothetical protein
LQDLNKKVYAEASVPHIVFLLQESQEKYDAAVDLIEEMTKPKPPSEQVSVPVKAKQTKVVKPSILARPRLTSKQSRTRMNTSKTSAEF